MPKTHIILSEEQEVSIQETATFRVDIRLSTEQGELPTDVEVERLVADQMGGVLDEHTGLRTIAVFDIQRVAETEPTGPDHEEILANLDEELEEAMGESSLVRKHGRLITIYRIVRKAHEANNEARLADAMTTIEKEIFS